MTQTTGEQETTDSRTEPQSFEAIVATDTLKAFIEVQTALVNEARWHVEDDGIRARAVDPGNVAMFEVTLSARAFESYTGTGMLGMNLSRLYDYITSKAAGDLVQLSIEPETRKLAVDVGTTSYTMALINPESIHKEPEIPDLDLSASIGLDGATFTNAIDAAALVSDHVYLSADPDARTFNVDGRGDTDDAQTSLGDEELLLANVGEDVVESVYSLDYLKDMTKPIGGDAAVSVELGDEKPVVMEYRLAEEHVEVHNMLAPRIQTR